MRPRCVLLLPCVLFAGPGCQDSSNRSESGDVSSQGIPVPSEAVASRFRTSGPSSRLAPRLAGRVASERRPAARKADARGVAGGVPSGSPSGAPQGHSPARQAGQYPWCPTGTLSGLFYGAPATVTVNAQTMNQFLLADSNGVRVGDGYLLMTAEIRAGRQAYVFDAEIEMPGGSGFGTLVSYATGERVRIWIMLFERGFGMCVNAMEAGHGIEGSAQFVFACN
jgi:hypothetical protein